MVVATCDRAYGWNRQEEEAECCSLMKRRDKKTDTPRRNVFAAEVGQTGWGKLRWPTALRPRPLLINQPATVPRYAHILCPFPRDFPPRIANNHSYFTLPSIRRGNQSHILYIPRLALTRNRWRFFPLSPILCPFPIINNMLNFFDAPTQKTVLSPGRATNYEEIR